MNFNPDYSSDKGDSNSKPLAEVINKDNLAMIDSVNKSIIAKNKVTSSLTPNTLIDVITKEAETYKSAHALEQLLFTTFLDENYLAQLEPKYLIKLAELAIRAKTGPREFFLKVYQAANNNQQIKDIIMNEKKATVIDSSKNERITNTIFQLSKRINNDIINKKVDTQSTQEFNK